MMIRYILDRHPDVYQTSIVIGPIRKDVIETTSSTTSDQVK